MNKKEARIFINNLSQINDELDRRTNSIGDSMSEVASNSMAAQNWNDQHSQHNFDVISQYTNKSSYYNIKKLR